ncbi:MAG: two component transcriptional regulator, LuxR family [Thermomicrobiales bacterium]|nr:two component transcriptional regulator, LuxR family [Thermomicrobiales bacterium]
MTPTSAALADLPPAERLAALAAHAATPFASLDDAINSTLTLLADLAGISLTMIHRLEGDNLVISHACDRMGLGIQTPVTVPRAHTFCDAVLNSLAPLVVHDADTDPYLRRLPGKQFVGTRSYLSVPIVLGNGRVFGTLCAHDRRVLDLGQSEVDAMRILARLIASQIERAEALDQAAATARYLAAQNRELSDALRQLDALREVVESISSELDLEALLERIIASAVALLDAHAGAISLVGADIDAPRRLVATHNLEAEGLAIRGIPARAGLMGEVLARRGPVIVERYDDVAQPLPDSAFHRLAPWIAVPIWWQGDIVGTFGVAGNEPGRRFAEREMALLANFAKHAAVAIENARLYAASRDLGVSEERNRLAREIHDTLAQSLLTLTFQLRAARGAIGDDPAGADAELRSAEANARAALEEARRSVWNLGPAALETGSLVEALGAEAAPGRAGLPCRLVVTGAARPLTGDVQLTLLRVAQEAIANARKHAQASQIEIRLEFGEDEVTLSVADDGRGLDPAVKGRLPASSGGFGLSSMADRLRQIGGSLDVRGGLGNGPGTTIVATVPYPPAITEPRAAPAPIPEENKIRVVVVDDHPATRTGLAALLDAQPDMATIGQAANGEVGVRLVAALRPDVALIDLRLPKLGGVETIARLTRMHLPTRIIVVTSFAQDELVLQALRAGAQGYLLKDASGDELAAAVRAVGGGGSYLTPLVAGKLASTLTQAERLTPREQEVLHLVGQGLADKEIAVALGTSTKTAQFHVANVLGKLGAQNRTDAVRIAYARGLIEV